MIFGRWGSFGRFVMLTTGIGLVSSVDWCLFAAALGGWKVMADDVEIFSLIVAVGAGFGLFMGVPAYWLVRLFVRWIPSRTVSVLFFALGAASVVVSVLIIAMVSGGSFSDLASLFTVSEAGDLMGLPVIAALGGIFTAVCVPLVLRPAPVSLNHESHPGQTTTATE